jgi:hypothetical protein
MARYRIAPALTLALSLLGMAAVSPAFAQTAPSLQISDGLGHSVTVTPAGGAVCSATGCSTDPAFPVITAGKIIWQGKVGDFTITGAAGAANHSTPTLDMGTVGIVSGATGGTLTITWSDIGFLGSGPVVMTTLTSVSAGTADAVYKSYTDDTNTINGTGTTVGTIVAPATFSFGNGPSVQPFSMTEVETITMSPNSAFNNDDQMAASPTGPIVVSCAAGSGQVGVVYNSAVQVTGGQAPFTFSISSGSIPNGLTLDAVTGTIKGTPAVAGLFSFTVLVTDSTGNFNSSGACGINVLASSGQINPLTLTCAGGTGTANVPYSSQFVATGGTAPYTFAVTSGTLPKGLTLSKTGALTGTPTTAGTYSFSVTVTDSTTLKAVTLCKACSITINTTTTTPLDSGDTATIGFWHNKNGQALINALNGGPTATALGNTLATNFPHMYASLAGKSNSYIANLFLTYFNASGQKTNAQVLAGALAAYVTNGILANGTIAHQYGFDVSTYGTGIKTFNVGTNGAALGLANHQSYTVLALLQTADAKFPWSNAVANALNSVFSAINQTGDII